MLPVLMTLPVSPRHPWVLPELIPVQAKCQPCHIHSRAGEGTTLQKKILEWVWERALHVQTDYLTLYTGSTIDLLCDHGPVTQPLWASASQG